MTVPANNTGVYPCMRLNDCTSQNCRTFYTDAIFNNYTGTDGDIWSYPTTFANLCRRILQSQTVTGDIQLKHAMEVTLWNLLSTTTIALQPLCRSSRISWHSQLRTGGVCCSQSFTTRTCGQLCEVMKFISQTRWRFLATFLRPVFAESRVQHISDLHSKFALGPRHV